MQYIEGEDLVLSLKLFLHKMAKVKGGSGSSQKTTFGKRKSGVAKKAHNKHDKKERNYRGQGR